jgi:hypothetical protein
MCGTRTETRFDQLAARGRPIAKESCARNGGLSGCGDLFSGNGANSLEEVISHPDLPEFAEDAQIELGAAARGVSGHRLAVVSRCQRSPKARQ